LEESANAVRSIISEGTEKAMAQWNSDLGSRNADR